MSFVWVPRSLRKQDNLTEKQKILLGEMEESAHRMLRMINLSLDLFRMEEGTYQFEPEDLNVIRILHNVHRDLESVLRARRVRLDVRVDGMPCSNGTCRVVRGEELLFHSMLANIVRNAVESSSAGDTVTVDCCFGSQAEIRVHNTGLVPEEIKENFFDKYVTCGKKFGTGLGTYSARLSAETQGGTLSMSSEEGKGTTVLLSFPSPDGSGRW
jgi:signal transduction histidine kinase